MATRRKEPARLAPFTLPHFLAYSSRLVLDTGFTWQVEDFQVELFEPILAGVREVWGVIPEGNGKSSAMAAYALYHCDYTPQPWVPIGASSRDQAEILFMQAAGIIRSTPGMTSRFRVYEGYRKIISLRNGGRGIKVYPADANTGDGVIPTLVLCDEGHRWPDLALYRVWKGKLDKRDGQIVMISTAGEPGGEFEEMRDNIRSQAPHRVLNGAHMHSVGEMGLNGVPSIVMNEWCVQNEKDVSNMEKVKEANPFSGITVETLTAHYKSPTTDLGDFKRLKCNIPARTVQAAITEPEWEKAGPNGRPSFSHGIPAEVRIDLGVDVAWKHDTFAIVPLWRVENSYEGEYELEDGNRLLGDPIILKPPRDGSSMHPDDVKMAFESIMELNPVDTVIIDMERAEDIVAWLEDECGVVVVDRPQGNANAVEDYDAFMAALRNGTLRHTGHHELRSHVMNAIARAMPGDKRRFDRPSQSRAKKRQNQRVIDALTAAAMVNHYAGEFTGGDPLVAWS